ncbi:hypothetical protein IPL44_02815 [Candidatus Saccharibacteria bacterium]|jgi:hypothetical protein|nr:MAG: hypothetical protein IPL44_02815 [Candidatus Saccharibacteria bacterium]
MSQGTIILMLIIVLIVGIGLLVFMNFTKGGPSLLDREKYRSAWLKIENGLDKTNLDTYHFAVLSADKLLDQALKESGVPGETMGDRLKAAKKQFSNINQVWSAHKIRNQVAHEANTKIDFIGCRRALAIFKRSLKELGAI